MNTEIWESSDQRIHVLYQGDELQFADIDDFIDALVIWQEYALRSKLESIDNPSKIWSTFSQDCIN